MGFKLTTLVVIGTDCTGSCKSIYPLGTPVSSTNKIDHHDITEILFKVALSTISYLSTKVDIIVLCFGGN
jgi:hypothetical protein